MTKEKKSIDLLMSEKIFGLIQPDDDLELREALNEDPALQHRFNVLRRSAERFEHTPAISSWDLDESFDQVMLEARRKKKRKRGALALLTVVCAALTAIFVVRLPVTKNTIDAHSFTGFAPASKVSPILLTTAGGTQVMLADDGIQDIEGAKVSNNAKSKTLSFLTPPPGASTGLNKLTVPPGMDYRLVLPDGSEVYMNSASSIEFPFRFDGANREVILKGEAFFKIMKRESQPFVVKSDRGDITVLGTSFNVNSYALETVKITLVEGAVAFRCPGSQLRLAPGEALTYNTKTGAKKSALNEDDLLWMKGMYRLDNTPLGNIRDLVKRWYNVDLDFENPAIEKERFTGTIFKKEPLETFLKTLELTSGIKYNYDQTPNGCNTCASPHVRLRGGEN